MHRRLVDLAHCVGGGLLALDSSVQRGSFCLVADAAVREVSLDARAMPSESLAPAVAKELQAAALGPPPTKLAAIVVGLGPGSFTGLRVGLSLAKGIALGARVPLLGVSSLALIAASHGPGLVAPVMDARRGDIFCGLYQVSDDGEPSTLLEDAARRPEAFVEAIAESAGRQRRSPSTVARIVGVRASQFPCLQSHFAEAPFVETPEPRAALALLMAAARLRAGQSDSLDTLSPRYLRASEAERQLGLDDG